MTDIIYQHEIKVGEPQFHGFSIDKMELAADGTIDVTIRCAADKAEEAAAWMQAAWLRALTDCGLVPADDAGQGAP